MTKPEKRKKNFYAYRNNDGGSGIVRSWAECEAKVAGKPARYRGFITFAEAKAWLAGGARYEEKAEKKRVELGELPADAIFSDAGTGGGRGVEINVTDRDGIPLLFTCLSEKHLTPDGYCILNPGRTNNYGELLALLLAMRIAKKRGSKVVYSDSELVLNHWSKGHVTTKKRQSDPDLYALAQKTAQERRAYELSGGILLKVSGGINPADLGHHRD